MSDGNDVPWKVNPLKVLGLRVEVVEVIYKATPEVREKFFAQLYKSYFWVHGDLTGSDDLFREINVAFGYIRDVFYREVILEEFVRISCLERQERRNQAEKIERLQKKFDDMTRAVTALQKSSKSQTSRPMKVTQELPPHYTWAMTGAHVSRPVLRMMPEMILIPASLPCYLLVVAEEEGRRFKELLFINRRKQVRVYRQVDRSATNEDPVEILRRLVDANFGLAIRESGARLRQEFMMMAHRHQTMVEIFQEAIARLEQNPEDYLTTLRTDYSVQSASVTTTQIEARWAGRQDAMALLGSWARSVDRKEIKLGAQATLVIDEINREMKQHLSQPKLMDAPKAEIDSLIQKEILDSMVGHDKLEDYLDSIKERHDERAKYFSVLGSIDPLDAPQTEKYRLEVFRNGIVPQKIFETFHSLRPTLEVGRILVLSNGTSEANFGKTAANMRLRVVGEILAMERFRDSLARHVSPGTDLSGL